MKRLLATTSVVILLASTARSQGDTLGLWFSRAPLPTPRQEVPHAVLEGKIYVPGGFGSGGIGSTVVEVFDPATNSWSTIAPLPEPLQHLGFAAANGKLYVLGGYVGNSFIPMDRVYEYLPDSNVWRQKTSMPAARGAHTALTFEGKIYVIGGVETGNVVSRRNEEYDPLADSWQTKLMMPTEREHLAGAVIDSLIYIVGGRVGSSNRNTLEAYSPTTNTWYARANMPTARGGLAAATLNGRLYVFGGEIPQVYEENEEYNPATNTWRTMAPMPTPRHGIGAATVGDSIFIIGGAKVAGFGVTDSNEVFTLSPLTGIREVNENLPLNFCLYQNYPNPFNPVTVIRYRLPVTSVLTLKVYNVLGQEIMQLVNEVKQAGNYEVTWDASRQSSGVYFYRLQTSKFADTKKLLFLR